MTPHEPLEALRQARTFYSQKDLAGRLGKSASTLRRWERGETPPPLVLSTLRALLDGRGSPPTAFTFVDLFAGIGGLRTAFESIHGRCVFTSEWNKYSTTTYKANFPGEHPLAGDITEVAAAEIPDHDLLLAGFPCQPFSLAGVSKKNSLGRAHGFACKTQGTLFFDVCRILEEKRPAAFLLENVKNLRSHDAGRTYRVICESLQELGYQISARILDARPWVPQHRERVFIAGWKEGNSHHLDQVTSPASGPRLDTILHRPDEEPEAPYTLRRNGRTVADDRYTLSDPLWRYLQQYAAKHKAAGNGFGCSVFGPRDVARTLSARYHKDGSEILIRQKGRNPRRLTPRECARLMGFDRPGQPLFQIPVSDTKAYRQFGNAVVVPVVEAVARSMQPYLVHTSHFALRAA